MEEGNPDKFYLHTKENPSYMRVLIFSFDTVVVSTVILDFLLLYHAGSRASNQSQQHSENAGTILSSFFTKSITAITTFGEESLSWAIEKCIQVRRSSSFFFFLLLMFRITVVVVFCLHR